MFPRNVYAILAYFNYTIPYVFHQTLQIFWRSLWSENPDLHKYACKYKNAREMFDQCRENRAYTDCNSLLSYSVSFCNLSTSLQPAASSRVPGWLKNSRYKFEGDWNRYWRGSIDIQRNYVAGEIKDDQSFDNWRFHAFEEKQHADRSFFSLLFFFSFRRSSLRCLICYFLLK